MMGVNAASCSSAKGHVIELGAAIGDDARARRKRHGRLQIGAAACRGVMETGKSKAAVSPESRKGRTALGTAESVMPQRDPIDDVKGDVIEIDLSERPPETGRDECHALENAR
jgi:hypothetical protein